MKLDHFKIEFSAIFPLAGRSGGDEGIAIFGRAEGVHPEAGADEAPVMVTNAAMKLLNNSMVDEVAFQTPNRRSRRW